MQAPIRVRVYHSEYGCDTGCCGHTVEITDGSCVNHSHFEFDHNYDAIEAREWARGLAEGVIRERWPECLGSIDWDSLEFEVSED